MIDFRYHIVSIMAVFLALGLGILMGTTFLDRAVVEVLEGRVEDVGQRADRVRDEAAELSTRLEQSNTLVRELAPWVVQGRLANHQVVFVTDAGSVRWRDAVRGAIVRAGASNVGTLTLTERWALPDEQDRTELVELMQLTPAFDPGDDPARAALTLLGERLLEPTGHDLVQRLVDSRFLVLDATEPFEVWPPPGSVVVGLASSRPQDALQPAWLGAFTHGAAAITPTLVVAASPEDHSAVTLLRAGDASPPFLATFDSGDADPSGIGSVLALRAAIDQRGGHFGAAEGLAFVPEPAPPSPLVTVGPTEGG